jgi:hypothetical protein
MPTDVQDLRSTIIPRSDQLNSEQLLGGPIIITVSDVRAGGGEDQPVSIFYEADPGRPYKPCKTMRKVLILAWGPDGTQWIGKSMELYCEPSVKFGGEVVGGIRISRLSDIPKEIKVSLTATKGRKSMHEIGLLKSSPALTACLAAITAATGRESLQKARALAEALTAEGDIALARSAYAKKVAELKSCKPAAPVIPADDDDGGTDLTKTLVLSLIDTATTTEQIDAAVAQIAQLEDAADQAECNAAATKKRATVGEPA